MASWYAFTAGAPYILVHFLDLPPTAYGEYILIPMAGYIAGNYVAARYSVRLGVDRMMFVGVWISVGAALLFLVWTAQGVTPLAIFVPMALSVFGNGISQPNATAGGISVNPRLAGTASGLMGFLQTVAAAAATVLIGFIQPTGPLAMVGVIVGANLLGLVSALATKYQPREAQRQGG
jgi:DHA1 family bicyclomycin/chloramphenicol resistance-like MFS transporter